MKDDQKDGISPRLRRISRVLGQRPTTDVRSFMETASAQREAETELYALIESDPQLSAIMTRFRATRQTLEKTYRRLCSLGAAQWVRGHWVAASALAFGPTLAFVLSNAEQEGRDAWLDVAYRLVEYFEKGEVELSDSLR